MCFVQHVIYPWSLLIYIFTMYLNAHRKILNFIIKRHKLKLWHFIFKSFWFLKFSVLFKLNFMHTKLFIYTVAELLSFQLTFLGVSTTETPSVKIKMYLRNLIFSKFDFLKTTPMQTAYDPNNATLEVLVSFCFTCRNYHINTYAKIKTT